MNEALPTVEIIVNKDNDFLTWAKSFKTIPSELLDINDPNYLPDIGSTLDVSLFGMNYDFSNKFHTATVIQSDGLIGNVFYASMCYISNILHNYPKMTFIVRIIRYENVVEAAKAYMRLSESIRQVVKKLPDNISMIDDRVLVLLELVPLSVIVSAGTNGYKSIISSHTLYSMLPGKVEHENRMVKSNDVKHNTMRHDISIVNNNIRSVEYYYKIHGEIHKITSIYDPTRFDGIYVTSYMDGILVGTNIDGVPISKHKEYGLHKTPMECEVDLDLLKATLDILEVQDRQLDRNQKMLLAEMVIRQEREKHSRTLAILDTKLEIEKNKYSTGPISSGLEKGIGIGVGAVITDLVKRIF